MDGLKLRVHGRAQERLRHHPLIVWRSKGKSRKGLDRFKGRWEAFTFDAVGGRVLSFRGSFHKYAEGGENCEVFTLSKFTAAVTDVCVRLGLHPSNLTVHNVEFGVNVCPPIPTRDVLARIVEHRGKAPAHMVGADIGHGIRLAHSTCGLKIYNKARQYGKDGESTRYEIYAKKMAALHGVTGRTLADLLDPGVWVQLQTLALRRFDELLILDPSVNVDALSPSDRDLFANAARPEYWQGLKPSTRCDQRRRFERIQGQHGTEGLKAELRRRIAEAFAAAIDVEPRMFCPRGQEVDALPVEPPRTSCPLVIKGQNVRTVDPPGRVSAEGVGKARKVPAAAVAVGGEGHGPSSPRLNNNQDQSTDGTAIIPGPPCKTCGRPTGSTWKGSRFCSARVYGEQAAKACRNADSNPRNNRRKAIERVNAGGTLFDQRAYIRPINTAEYGGAAI